MDNTPSDLINIANPPVQEVKQNNNLLDVVEPPVVVKPPVHSNNSLIDLGGEAESVPKPYQTSAGSSAVRTDNTYATSVIENQPNQGSSIFDFIAAPAKTSKNIVIPFVEVIE